MTYEELRDNIKMELGIEAPDETAPDLEQRIDSNIKLVTDSLQDEEEWFPLKEERSFTIVSGTTTYDFEGDIKEMLFASTTDGEVFVVTPDVLKYKYPDTSEISSFICIVPNYRTHKFDAYKAESATLYVYCRVRGDTTDLLGIGGGFAKLIKYGVLKEMAESGSTKRSNYEADYLKKLEQLKAQDAQREYDSEFDVKPPEWVINFLNARQGLTVV